MDRESKISFLYELISCFQQQLYHWDYDAELYLVESSCPDEALFRRFFITKEQQQIMLEHCRNHASPLFLSNAMSMVWIAAPEKKDRALHYIHVLGPFFPDHASAAQCKSHIDQLDTSFEKLQELRHAFQAIPILSINQFSQCASVLHFCLTGEKIDFSEIPHLGLPSRRTETETRTELDNLRRHHEMELEMIRMIREGNLNRKELIGKMPSTPRTNQGRQETLRQVKNRTYARAGLVSQAAIDGGLSPETSLPLLYQYLDRMENCPNIAELGALTLAMEHDFSEQVRRRRTSAMSKAALDCCDYIHLHLEEEELSRASLARTLNYSEGYLSRKFKQEMGTSIKDYITQQRLERARELLKNTEMSVQDISERLHFGSHSYFAAAFKKAYQLTPKQWREQPRQKA